MTFKEIAQKIDKSNANKCYNVLDAVCPELEVYDNFFDCVEQTRLTAYWIGAWYDTEGWCGHRLYFLDDEPVAYSFQSDIGYTEQFHWFGRENALKVRDYLLSLLPAKEVKVTTVGVEEEFGNGFHVPFSSQVLDWSKARYHGVPLKSIERIKGKPDYGIDTELKISLPTAEEKVISVRDLEFQFHLA